MAKGRKEMLDQLILVKRVGAIRKQRLKIIRMAMVNLPRWELKRLNQVLIESLYPGRKPYMKQESSY